MREVGGGCKEGAACISGRTPTKKNGRGRNMALKMDADWFTFSVNAAAVTGGGGCFTFAQGSGGLRKKPAPRGGARFLLL